MTTSFHGSPFCEADQDESAAFQSRVRGGDTENSMGVH